MAHAWSLPESIVEGITHHHSPEQATSEAGRHVSRLVHLGDAVAHSIGAQDGDPSEGYPQSAARALGISSGGFGELCRMVDTQFEDVLSSYGC